MFQTVHKFPHTDFELTRTGFNSDAEIKPRWQLWACQNGQTPTIRTHLRTHHPDEWRDAVLANELKGWQKLAVKGADDPSSMPGLNFPRPEPFTKAGLDMKLADLIAADDHVSVRVQSLGIPH